MASSPVDFPTDSPADAVTRRVNTVTRGGDEVRRIVLRRTCPAGAEEVWSALTEADRIERWLHPVSGDLEIGGRFQFEGGARGEVLECQAAERLAITWSDDGAVSRVDISLRPVTGGTLLQVDHTAPPPTCWTAPIRGSAPGRPTPGRWPPSPTATTPNRLGPLQCAVWRRTSRAEAARLTGRPQGTHTRRRGSGRGVTCVTRTD